MKIYVSGPHAVGKTKTIETLAERHPDWWRTFYDDKKLKPQDHDNPFGFDDVFRRQMWRCLVYAKDELQFHKLEQSYPLLIIDRHPIENLIYSDAFHEKGWMSDASYQKLEEVWKALFKDVDGTDVLLMPPLEFQKAKIARVKNTDDRKIYREDDWVYLEMLRKKYEERQWPLVIRTPDLEQRIRFIEEYIGRRN